LDLIEGEEYGIILNWILMEVADMMLTIEGDHVVGRI
jgi:hypothetical protein